MAEAVSCLNRALSALGDIWEEIGIPEELRVERTGAVKKHVKVSGAPGGAGRGAAASACADRAVLQNLLDMMVAEEEHLKEQLLKSVAAYRKELDGLCTELQAEPFQVRDAAPRAGGHSRRLSARPPALCGAARRPGGMRCCGWGAASARGGPAEP